MAHLNPTPHGASRAMSIYDLGDGLALEVDDPTIEQLPTDWDKNVARFRITSRCRLVRREETRHATHNPAGAGGP